MSDSNVANDDSLDPVDDESRSDEALASTDEFFENNAAHSKDEFQQAEERVLRAQAELENFRKRARRELDEQRRYAAIPLVTELLPVLDNLERALDAAERQPEASGLLAGVKMVSEQLRGVLEKHECRRIEDLGKPFDPNLHEAIGQEPSEEHEAGVVSRVTQAGYQMHDRVVRPSQVMISLGPMADSSVDNS